MRSLEEAVSLHFSESMEGVFGYNSGFTVEVISG